MVFSIVVSIDGSDKQLKSCFFDTDMACNRNFTELWAAKPFKFKYFTI